MTTSATSENFNEFKVETMTMDDLKNYIEELKGLLAAYSNDKFEYFEDVITSKFNESLEEYYEEAINALPFSIPYFSTLYEEQDSIAYRGDLLNYADQFDVKSEDLYEETENCLGSAQERLEELEELEDEE